MGIRLRGILIRRGHTRLRRIFVWRGHGGLRTVLIGRSHIALLLHRSVIIIQVGLCLLSRRDRVLFSLSLVNTENYTSNGGQKQNSNTSSNTSNGSSSNTFLSRSRCNLDGIYIRGWILASGGGGISCRRASSRGYRWIGGGWPHGTANSSIIEIVQQLDTGRRAGSCAKEIFLALGKDHGCTIRERLGRTNAKVSTTEPRKSSPRRDSFICFFLPYKPRAICSVWCPIGCIVHACGDQGRASPVQAEAAPNGNRSSEDAGISGVCTY